jgi:hypothetical protein
MIDKKNSDLQFFDNPWKPGLPPGKVDPEKYEVYFSPIGTKWHRRKEITEAEND